MVFQVTPRASWTSFYLGWPPPVLTSVFSHPCLWTTLTLVTLASAPAQVGAQAQEGFISCSCDSLGMIRAGRDFRQLHQIQTLDLDTRKARTQGHAGGMRCNCQELALTVRWLVSDALSVHHLLPPFLGEAPLCRSQVAASHRACFPGHRGAPVSHWREFICSSKVVKLECCLPGAVYGHTPQLHLPPPHPATTGSLAAVGNKLSQHTERGALLGVVGERCKSDLTTLIGVLGFLSHQATQFSFDFCRL